LGPEISHLAAGSPGFVNRLFFSRLYLRSRLCYSVASVCRL